MPWCSAHTGLAAAGGPEQGRDADQDLADVELAVACWRCSSLPDSIDELLMEKRVQADESRAASGAWPYPAWSLQIKGFLHCLEPEPRCSAITRRAAWLSGHRGVPSVRKSPGR